MFKLLNKEIRLASSKLSFLFLLMSLFALIPNYPILVGTFFVCLGIFQSFQFAREQNDIIYSVLLPVAKRDVVTGKFQFALLIELAGFFLSAVLTLIRMTALGESGPYANNVLMNANFAFLGYVLVIFGLFNLLFIAGYFKTAYYFGKPFVAFCVVSFLAIGIFETLHHLPGLEGLNAPTFTHLPLQFICLAAGSVFYILATWIAFRTAQRRFEQTDL